MAPSSLRATWLLTAGMEGIGYRKITGCSSSARSAACRASKTNKEKPEEGSMLRVSKVLMFAAIALLVSGVVIAQELKPITLPAPQTHGGKPVMDALALRATSRDFVSTDLPMQTLSNLLWAAWGINRPDQGKHTAPSSNNKQEMSLYVALESGLYLYVPESQLLKQIHNRDIRKATGKQDFVEIAPVNLIYVSDLIKAGVSNPDKAGPEALNTSAINTGFMAQNVYLWCASEKLACVVRGWVDIPELSKAMELAPHQRIIIAQTVGYPKK